MASLPPPFSPPLSPPPAYPPPVTPPPAAAMASLPTYFCPLSPPPAYPPPAAPPPAAAMASLPPPLCSPLSPSPAYLPPAAPPPAEPDVFVAISNFLALLDPFIPPRPYGPHQYEGYPVPDEPGVPQDPSSSYTEMEEIDPPPPTPPPIIHLYPPLSYSSTLDEKVNKWMSDAFLDTYLQQARLRHPRPERYAVEDGEEIYNALLNLHEEMEKEITRGDYRRLMSRMEKRAEGIWNILLRMTTDPEELKLKLIKYNSAWGIFPPGWQPDRSLYAMYKYVPLRLLFNVDDLDELGQWMLEDDDDNENAYNEEQEPYMILTSRLIGPAIHFWITWATSETPTVEAPMGLLPPAHVLPAPRIPAPTLPLNVHVPTEQRSVSYSRRKDKQKHKERILRVVERLLEKLLNMLPTEEARSRILKRKTLIMAMVTCIRTQMERIISEQRTGRVQTAGFALCTSYGVKAYQSKPLDALEELLVNLSEILLCNNMPWLP